MVPTVAGRPSQITGVTMQSTVTWVPSSRRSWNSYRSGTISPRWRAAPIATQTLTVVRRDVHERAHADDLGRALVAHETGDGAIRVADHAILMNDDPLDGTFDDGAVLLRLKPERGVDPVPIHRVRSARISRCPSAIGVTSTSSAPSCMARRLRIGSSSLARPTKATAGAAARSRRMPAVPDASGRARSTRTTSVFRSFRRSRASASRRTW